MFRACHNTVSGTVLEDLHTDFGEGGRWSRSRNRNTSKACKIRFAMSGLRSAFTNFADISDAIAYMMMCGGKQMSWRGVCIRLENRTPP
jgi:hypothetical protein